MQFKDIIGQEDLKENLVQLVQQNRLSHALLFLGKEGSGALPAALAFCQYIACEKVNGKFKAEIGPSMFGEDIHGGNDQPILHDSCGVCSSCIKSAKLVHPDIHFSYPVVSKKAGEKPISTDYITEWREFISTFGYGNIYDWLQFIGAENKQGNITADECNDIIRKLSLKSFESEYKIVLMWMPEYLGNVGNKLLKIIEEPPANTLFILVAENENAIIQTILSRTQLIKVPALTDQEIAEALVTRAAVNESKAQQIASVSEGNYREALQLLQHAEEDWQGLLRDWLNAILKTGPVAQVKWIDEVSKLGREKQKQFLRYFIHLLEQSVRLRVISNSDDQPNNGLNIPEHEKDFALRLNKLCSLEAQQAIISELDKASYYIERNANGKMLFHALSIRFYHIIKDNSLILVN